MGDDGLLKSADPEWLKQVLLGVQIMLAASIFLAIINQTDIDRAIVHRIGLAGHRLLCAPGSLAFTYGCWLLSTPEPSELNAGRSDYLQTALRISLIVHLLYVAYINTLPLLDYQLHRVVFVCLHLAYALSMGLIYFYIRGLLLKIPSEALARTAIFFSVVIPLMHWILPTINYLQLISRLLYSSLNILQFGLTLLALVFLNAFRLELQGQLALARLKWAGRPADAEA
jgi:hypothetical protein